MLRGPQFQRDERGLECLRPRCMDEFGRRDPESKRERVSRRERKKEKSIGPVFLGVPVFGWFSFFNDDTRYPVVENGSSILFLLLLF